LPLKLACPTHRIDFNKAFNINPGDCFTAKTIIDIKNERFLRYMIHSAHNNISLILDGETVIKKDVGDPYLPAYHRPCPDFKTQTMAGKHSIEISVTASNSSEEFAVAFQLADLSDIFVKGRGWLQDDIEIAFDFE